MATESDAEHVFENLDNALKSWEKLLESEAYELAQKRTSTLRRLASLRALPGEAANATERESHTFWLRQQASLWYRWVPALCQGIRGEVAGSCSILCFLFEGAKRFLIPLCGLEPPGRLLSQGRLPQRSRTVEQPGWRTFVPVSERYRLHLGLVYDSLRTALEKIFSLHSSEMLLSSHKRVMDQNTWVCQLMRCLGVVVHNTPFRCLPREQLLALMQSIWERYALSVGPETETLRAAALSCLKHIHMRLGTLPPLHLFLADRARWTDSHVLSFVEAMLTMRIRLGESRHQVAAEDDLLDDLLRQLIRTHLEGSTTPPAMRLQAARLLRLKLRLHSSPAKADDVLVRRLLQDSFHAVRAVAVECLSQNGIEMISPAIFSELKAQASDSTASMRAAACTTLGRMLLSDSVSESFSTDGDAALISGTDDLRRRVMELLVQRLLSDPNIHVRAAVAATLGNLCSKEGSLSHFLPESAISKAVEELDRAPYSSHASAYCRFLATVMPDETQRLDIVSMIGRILQGARRKQLRYQAALALAKHLRKTDDVTLWSLVKRYGSQQQSP